MALPITSLASLFSLFAPNSVHFRLETGNFDVEEECRYLGTLLDKRHARSAILWVHLRAEHFEPRTANDENGE